MLQNDLKRVNAMIDQVFVSVRMSESNHVQLKRLASKSATEAALQQNGEWLRWRGIERRYLSLISRIVLLFEEKDRLLQFHYVYSYSQMNTSELEGYLVNNYDIILTTLSSSGLAVFDSDCINRQYFSRLHRS